MYAFEEDEKELKEKNKGKNKKKKTGVFTQRALWLRLGLWEMKIWLWMIVEYLDYCLINYKEIYARVSNFDALNMIHGSPAKRIVLQAL